MFINDQKLLKSFLYIICILCVKSPRNTFSPHGTVKGSIICNNHEGIVLRIQSEYGGLEKDIILFPDQTILRDNNKGSSKPSEYIYKEVLTKERIDTIIGEKSLLFYTSDIETECGIPEYDVSAIVVTECAWDNTLDDAEDEACERDEYYVHYNDDEE